MSTTNVVFINAGTHRARVQARRDALAVEHLSLVDGIARAVARTLPPSFDVEDLVAVGYLALLQAATRYRPSQHGGAPFSAYARRVVRGAIVESVRRKWWDENTRPGIELTIGETVKRGRELATRPMIEQAIDAARARKRIAQAMSWLPPAEQRVLAAHYGADEPVLAEVGRRLGIGKRRAQRLHARGIEGLRRELKAA